MLLKTELLDEPGLRLEDVRCTSRRTGWCAPEPSTGHAVVFVRRGCFRRRVDGVEATLDPAVVYFERPGREQQVAHPHDSGDACTVFALAFGLVERAVLLLAAVLERAHPARVASGRPATVAARKRAVDATREALAARPAAGLLELARTVAVSPHHLSRTFSACTGEPISRYRNRIRARLALERLADGETSLARLAGELGFADQAHLTRVVRSEAGLPPSRLRAIL